MKTLLVNKPEGGQALLELQDSGSYFDAERVLWDTSADGPLPEGIQLGGMVRVNGALQLDEDLLAATQAADLAARRAAIWEQIKAHRELVSNTAGYEVTSGGVTKWFHSDLKSQMQQLALVVAGAGVPAVPWKTMDGTFVTMSQAWALAVFAAASAKEAAIFAKAEEHRIAVEASDNPDAYDWSTGWPAVYGGA